MEQKCIVIQLLSYFKDIVSLEAYVSRAGVWVLLDQLSPSRVKAP